MGKEARDGIEERGFPRPIEAYDRDELARVYVNRHVFEGLCLAVVDADILNGKERGDAIAKRGFGARRDLDAAAEIYTPHCFVAHHLIRSTLGNALANIHGKHTINQPGDALHIVIDEEHGAPIVAKLADEFGKSRRFL